MANHRSPKVPPEDQQVPENYKGYYNDDGFYVPTEEEMRVRFPDMDPNKDLSSDVFRTKVWSYPVTRNLTPFNDKHSGAKLRQKARIAQTNKITEYKEAKKEKEIVIQIIRNELKCKEEDIDPWQLLQLRARMAMLNDDWDKVESLAMNMLEYTTPKLARIESKVEDITKGKASNDDMEQFINGTLTYEEFLDRQQGIKPQ